MTVKRLWPGAFWVLSIDGVFIEARIPGVECLMSNVQCSMSIDGSEIQHFQVSRC